MHLHTPTAWCKGSFVPGTGG